MKRIYVITIAFLASWAVITANEDFDQDQSEESISTENVYADGIPTVCPVIEENPHNTTTNIPHETDCTKFYKCHVGRPIEQDCPLMIKNDPYTRLHYNRHKQVCDWPLQAGCFYCPEKDETGRYPSPDFIKHEINNCGEYYRCENGRKIRQTPCPVNTCFSRTCQRCVRHREGGYCGQSPPKSTTTTHPTSKSTITTPKSTTTTHPTPTPICWIGDRKSCCSKYFECQLEDGQNQWKERDCPNGDHFSPTEHECMKPDVAGCSKPPK